MIKIQQPWARYTVVGGVIGTLVGIVLYVYFFREIIVLDRPGGFWTPSRLMTVTSLVCPSVMVAVLGYGIFSGHIGHEPIALPLAVGWGIVGVILTGVYYAFIGLATFLAVTAVRGMRHRPKP